MPQLSVLDFYLHSSVKIRGIGKQLFEVMFEYKDATPSKNEYDMSS